MPEFMSSLKRRNKDAPVGIAGPGGRVLEMLEMLSIKNNFFECRIVCSKNYMRGYISFHVVDGKFEITPPEVENLLATAGIIHGIDNYSVAMLCEEINNTDEDIGLFQVANGTPPRDGEDGKLDFIVPPCNEDAQYDHDEFGNINYRELNLIKNALAGQLVATVLPPTQGTPGCDILGRRINVSHGASISFKTGDGIRTGKDGKKIFACENGYLIYDQNKKILRLSTVYHVEGDVDYSIGNIDFVGEVVIDGSVLDDFHVHGGKKVLVRGLVGASHISSDGNIIIEGGVTGKGKGSIKSEGDVRVKYLDEVSVEAEGNILVAREVLNCKILCAGKLSISSGTILGGDICAFGGIEASVIGSSMGIHTKLCSGIDYRRKHKLEELQEHIENTEAEVQQLADILEPVLANRTIFIELDDTHRDEARKLINELKHMKEHLRTLHELYSGYEMNIVEGRVCQINVTNRLFSGVFIKFPQADFFIKDSHRGPLSITENPKLKSINIEPLKPLVHVEQTPDDQ